MEELIGYFRKLTTKAVMPLSYVSLNRENVTQVVFYVSLFLKCDAEFTD